MKKIISSFVIKRIVRRMKSCFAPTSAVVRKCFESGADPRCGGFCVSEIAEDIAFFESFLSFRSTASNPEKIKQQLAARMILHSIDSNFPFADVEVLKGGKPVLKNNALKFSTLFHGWVQCQCLLPPCSKQSQRHIHCNETMKI